MRGRDAGWMVFAGAATVLGVLSGFAAAGLLMMRRWNTAAYVAPNVLAWYWFAAGAWLRTTRGKDDRGNPPPGPPVLSTERARLLVALAGLCALACAIALGGQWIATR